MVGILHTFGIELKGVFIYRFEEGVFSSELVMRGPDGVERRVDSRTSDAIALALRVDAEIYTTQDIVDRAGVEFEPEQEAAAAMHEPEQSIVEELRMQIAEAQAKLDKAIADEAYEEASHIRDNIKVLQMRLEAALHPGADDAKTE
jgi:bifunctional DNase/RNase